MKEQSLTIRCREYCGLDELSAADLQLMEAAIKAADGAYAPYSHFHVGAALRLADGSLHVGNNQENAAYPSGLCAERTAIFAAAAQRPQMRDYTALAIVGKTQDGKLCEASPCGACRQVLAEYEGGQEHPMRVLCYVDSHCIREFASVGDLLPYSFRF